MDFDQFLISENWHEKHYQIHDIDSGENLKNGGMGVRVSRPISI